MINYLEERNNKINIFILFKCRIGLRAFSKKCNTELLICVRLMLDISFAISYLPVGVLWGGHLKTWHVGALGTLSSLIGFYQALSERMQDKKHS